MKNAPVSRRAICRRASLHEGTGDNHAAPGFTELSAFGQDEHSGLGMPLTVMALAQDFHLVPSSRSAPERRGYDDCPIMCLSNSQSEL